MAPQDEELAEKLASEMERTLSRRIAKWNKNPVSEGETLSGIKPDDERKPKEEGGHENRTYSLDKRTRDYLDPLPDKSEVVEDAIAVYSLVSGLVKGDPTILPIRDPEKPRRKSPRNDALRT